jgi:membrane-associated phospholipid phosphatase
MGNLGATPTSASVVTVLEAPLEDDTPGIAMHPPACGNPGDAGNREAPYRFLEGPQVEPTAGGWNFLLPPRVVSIPEVLALTADPASPFYVPEYPIAKSVLEWEIKELRWLEENRDNPNEVTGNYSTEKPFPAAMPVEFQDAKRQPLSDFLQLDPPGFGAIFNISPDPINGRPYHPIGNINQQHLRRPILNGQSLLASGKIDPVVRTGRQLARMFQDETPGLVHRNALNYLLYKRFKISPPRQARIWMALNVAIYSALTAAWYYKWLHPQTRSGSTLLTHSYRQRPYEYDQNKSFRVLYDDVVDDYGLFNKCPRTAFCPSPGTPRHPAYPSGHSTYSAAASGVLAYFFPGETAQFEQLADNIGVARIWAGVHWRSDHIAGRLIGKAVADLIIKQLQRNCVPVVDTDPETMESNALVPSHAQVILDAVKLFPGDCNSAQDQMANQTLNPIPDCESARTQA